MLAEQGCRLAAFSPEGDVFDAMGGRYARDPNLNLFLKAHAGDTHRVDRRGGAGEEGRGARAEYLDKPALTLGLCPQPVVLERLRDKQTFKGRGMLGRFLWSRPESLVGRRAVRPPALGAATEAPYHQALLALAAIEYDAGISLKEELPRRLAFAPAADDALAAFEAAVEGRLRPAGDLAGFEEWGGKLCGTVVRVASLLHLAERALAGDARPYASPVPEACVRAATELAEYLVAHARACFALVADDSRLDGARRLKAWIEQRGPGEVSRRQAHRALQGHFADTAAVEKAFETLQDYGYVQEKPRPGPRPVGRPRGLVYLTNPLWLAAAGGAGAPAAVSSVSDETDSVTVPSAPVEPVSPGGDANSVILSAPRYAAPAETPPGGANGAGREESGSDSPPAEAGGGDEAAEELEF